MSRKNAHTLLQDPKQDITEKIQDSDQNRGAPKVQILPEVPSGAPKVQILPELPADTPQPPPETPSPAADTPTTPPSSTLTPPKQEKE